MYKKLFLDPDFSYSVREFEGESEGRTNDVLVFMGDGQSEIQMIFHEPDDLYSISLMFLQASQKLDITSKDGLKALGSGESTLQLNYGQKEHPTKEAMFGISDEQIQAFIGESEQ